MLMDVVMDVIALEMMMKTVLPLRLTKKTLNKIALKTKMLVHRINKIFTVAEDSAFHSIVMASMPANSMMIVLSTLITRFAAEDNARKRSVNQTELSVTQGQTAQQGLLLFVVEDSVFLTLVI